MADCCAVSTNSGTYVRDSFTVIPQLELDLGYQITCHWSVHAGYDLLYWGTVYRAADQISLDVDSAQCPSSLSPGGSKYPVFPDKTSSFLGPRRQPGNRISLLTMRPKYFSPFRLRERGRGEGPPQGRLSRAP